MPKGIRKACANCIKARLACDEGRPCQRCIVHQCECIAVPRKPRVKKQKLDLEPPIDIKPTHIPTIDSNVDVVTPNWAQSDYIQGIYSSFQLEKVADDSSSYEGFTNSMLSPTPRLSPPSIIDSPPLNMSSPPQQVPSSTSSVTSPVIQSSNPLSWSSSSINNSINNLINNNRQLQASLMQQYPQAAAAMMGIPLRNLQAIQQAVLQSQQPPVQQQPAQQAAPALTISPPSPVIPQQTQQQQQPSLLSQSQSLLSQSQSPLLRMNYDSSQMLSLLLDEKPALFNEWQDMQLGNYIDGQQIFNTNNTSMKKANNNPISALLQAKNSTPLFPSPIAVFDKQRFQLLDANETMAQFVGHTNVAELSTQINSMDDLIDPEAAGIAKNAYFNFVANPSPCFRICDVRTKGGQNKTVEFHIDLTEQLLILTIKSVFDTCSMIMPEVPVAHVKSDISSTCSCKACEFLSPID